MVSNPASGRKLHAGMLIERVAFQTRILLDDQAGNTEGDWDMATQILRPAGYIMRPGSEAFTAARIEARQPIIVFTYWDRQTATIKGGSSWRIVDQSDGTIFAVYSAADMDRSRRWLTCVCEAGVVA